MLTLLSIMEEFELLNWWNFLIVLDIDSLLIALPTVVILVLHPLLQIVLIESLQSSLVSELI
jgi:hypothetical protein